MKIVPDTNSSTCSHRSVAPIRTIIHVTVTMIISLVRSLYFYQFVASVVCCCCCFSFLLFFVNLTKKAVKRRVSTPLNIVCKMAYCKYPMVLSDVLSLFLQITNRSIAQSILVKLILEISAENFGNNVWHIPSTMDIASFYRRVIKVLSNDTKLETILNFTLYSTDQGYQGKVFSVIIATKRRC